MDSINQKPIWLGFDLGSKSLGVALRNRLGMILPLPALFFPRVVEEDLLAYLQGLINQYRPQLLIFGLPLNEDGGESNQTQWVKGVFHRLQSKVSIPMAFVDERFTTLEAKQRLHEFNIPEKKQRDYIDSISACILLEQYERKPR